MIPRVHDTTLRDGEQTVRVALDPDQKLAIARAIDSPGIERIEAGFPWVSAEDEWPELLARVKELGARKHGLVSDDEFRGLVDGR